MACTMRVDLNDSHIMGLELKDEADMNALNDDPNVLSVEPDYAVTAFEDPTVQDKLLNSTKRSLDEFIPFGVDMVLQKRKKFYKRKAKGKVKVCIADTGYDINHGDLPRSYVDGVDGSGEIWDYDGHSHGTHVAGIVGALGNGDGVYGVVPHDYKGKFELIITKAFGRNGSGSNSQTIQAIQDCVDKGAKVISMSLGCIGCYSSALDNFFQNLYNSDILLIAAAGNSGTSAYTYPASYQTVISVASITSNKVRSSFSQYNNQVELSAPGSSIYSTVPGGGYGIKSGTSMATPYVAGVAGLLRMFFPKCTNSQIRGAMAYTAQDLQVSGCDFETGHGLVQAENTFKLLKSTKCGSLKGNPTTGGCYELKRKRRNKKKQSSSVQNLDERTRRPKH